MHPKINSPKNEYYISFSENNTMYFSIKQVYLKRICDQSINYHQLNHFSNISTLLFFNRQENEKYVWYFSAYFENVSGKNRISSSCIHAYLYQLRAITTIIHMLFSWLFSIECEIFNNFH